MELLLIYRVRMGLFVDCKYAVVKQVVKGLRMGVSRDGTGDWDLTWTDGAVNA